MDISTMIESAASALPGYAAMILGIAFLILIHELGHWAVARFFGFKTPVFSIGFGKREWSLVLGTFWETEFRLSPILLGGYVSIPELQDETTAVEMLKGTGQDGEVKNFAVWKKISVAIAGVTMNMIFAVVAIAMLFAFIGEPSAKINHTGVAGLSQEITVASDAGIQPGDVFVSVDGQTVTTPDDLKSALSKAGGNPVTVIVDRGGSPVTVTLTPTDDGLIGIALSVDAEQVYTPMGIGEASAKAVGATYDATVGMFKGFGMMLGLVETPKNLPDGAADVHGVVGIVQIGAQAFDLGIFQFVWILAMISINLAVLNILPIPMLDGGHILFFTYEGITGKPVPVELKNKLSMIFFMLLMGLMVYGLFNDITKPISLK